MALTACGGNELSSNSVFKAEVGDCFKAAGEVKAQVSELEKVSCAEPHAHEAYALVAYEPPEDTQAYPGEDVLDRFARGVCAEEFGEYVGINYLDSDFFYTYLNPSPRSWQEQDRTTLCFVMAAGKPLVGTVKGSKT